MELAHRDHEVWAEIAPELQQHEFKYPAKMSVEALRRLSRIRRASGVPMRIVGDWRDPDAPFGADKSAHKETPCTAVDLRILNNNERHRLLRAAFAEGCPRIGVYMPTDYQLDKWGKGAGSIHLDFAPEEWPQERCWMSY